MNIFQIYFNDKKLAKFQKIQRLWKIFYTNDLKNELIKDISWETYFNEGYILILPLINDKINIKGNYTLKIEIKFKIFLIKWEINKNSKIISIKQINKNLIEIPFEAVFKNEKISDLENIIIYLNKNSIEIDDFFFLKR